MTLTAYVAQLLGVYLVLSGVLMIVREQAMMLLVPKFVDTPPFLYFLGSLRVLIGLAIVLAHNMWIGTLGTVICWLAHDSAWYCHARASRRNGAENSSGLFTWQRLVHNSDRRDRAWWLARLRRIHRVISWRDGAMHYQTLRSVSDNHVFLVCRDDRFYEDVPEEVRKLGPWQGNHHGEIEKLKPQYRLALAVFNLAKLSVP